MKSRPVNGIIALFVPLGWLAALLQACSRDIHVAADLGAGTLPQVADAEDTFGVLRTLFAWVVFAGLVVFLIARFRERTHTVRDSEEQKHPQEKYAFERTFFPLFRLRQEIVQGLQYKSKLGIDTIGQDSFEAMREDFVNIAKEQKMEIAADEYINLMNFDGDIRFDIISILFDNSGKHTLRHIEDAFWPE